MANATYETEVRFGSGANYMETKDDGEVILHGTAKTWEDLRIVPGAFQFAGNNDPTLQNWQPGGAGATYKVYKFKKNDEVFFTCQIPHNYQEGSDIRPHLHWTPCDRGSTENGNTVGWYIEGDIEEFIKRLKEEIFQFRGSLKRQSYYLIIDKLAGDKLTKRN